MEPYKTCMHKMIENVLFHELSVEIISTFFFLLLSKEKYHALRTKLVSIRDIVTLLLNYQIVQ